MPVFNNNQAKPHRSDPGELCNWSTNDASSKRLVISPKSSVPVEIHCGVRIKRQYCVRAGFNCSKFYNCKQCNNQSDIHNGW